MRRLLKQFYHLPVALVMKDTVEFRVYVCRLWDTFVYSCKRM